MKNVKIKSCRNGNKNPKNKGKCSEMGTPYNHILNHNLTVITLIIAAVRSAVMAAKRVWRIFLTRIHPKYIAIA